MDDDPVLRSLSADLERDDPHLAAYLSGRARSPRRHSPAWFLLAVPLFIAALLVSVPVTVGVTVILLVVASPFVACWLCATAQWPDAGRP
jgi:hypothetical protein